MGLLILPPLTNYLLEEFGFQGALILLAGVPLQGVVFGALIISPEKALAMQKRRHISTPLKKEKPDTIFTVLPEKDTFKLSDDIVTKSKAVEVSSEGPSLAKSQSYLKNSKTSNKTSSFCANLKRIVKATVDIHLFKNAVFVSFLISTLLLNFFYGITIVFMVDRAVSYGISTEAGSFLISATGIASIFSRLASGFTADFDFVRQRILYFYMMCVMGSGLVSVVSFGTPLVNQVAYSSLFGIFLGMYNM